MDTKLRLVYGVTDIFAPDPVAVSGTDFDGKTYDLRLPPNSFLAKASVFDATRMQKKFQKTEGVTLASLLWTLRHVTHGRFDPARYVSGKN